MIQTPAIVTEDGNILIHNQEGARLPLVFSGEDGADRDMTAATVAFMTSTGFRRELIPGDVSNELVLMLQPLDFAPLIGKMTQFIVRDETTPEKPVIWAGKLFVEGW